MDKVNILYIHSHDTGRYTSPYGHAMPTPRIQKLAEEGVLFRKAFCAAPTCSPSRASLLTGEYPHSNGQFGLAHRGFELADPGKHLINTLKQNGYYSALVGIQHIRKDPHRIGYDLVKDTDVNNAEKVASAAADFLTSKPSQPFFLSVGFFETHRRYHEPDPEDNPDYCLPPSPLPDTAEIRRDIAGFKASVRVLDKGIGAVLDSLKDNGLDKNTLVICTTDHGIAFPGMKCNLTDHGIGVMLIMRGPGGFSGGKAYDAMISHVDIFPTICDILNIKPPRRLQGKSFMPIIRQDKEEVNSEIFAEVSYHASYEPMRAVRTQRWKYIRRYTDRPTPFLANIDASPSKTLWMKYGLKNRIVAKEQLYDLMFDPNEADNLIDVPSKQLILEEMRDRLDSWMRNTGDPLLDGDIPAPKDAIINDPADEEPDKKMKS